MELDRNAHLVFLFHYSLIMCIQYRNKVIKDELSLEREGFVAEFYLLSTAGIAVDMIQKDIQSQGGKMANKAMKYRLYPTAEQAVMFAKTFGCCRKVYNLMLSDKIESYQLTGKFATVTPAKYKKDYPYLKEVDSLALANKQLDLQKAFHNYFHKTSKKNHGFPKYKSAKHSRKSYTTNNQKGTIALSENTVKLPKIGKVKAVIHRQPNPDWVIKSATISQESDGKYYVSVLFEFKKPVCHYMADLNNAIALDYTSNGLYMDSNGKTGSNHKYYRESYKKIAKAQRRLSRRRGSKKKKTKSKNYWKQLRKVNQIHRHIANQRLDHLHKRSTEIANQVDVVCVESLNLCSMANKGFGNGKATLDNGYGMFLSLLEYKLLDQNKYLVKVDQWYPSSQICSGCGYRNFLLKDLTIRKWDCPNCKAHHNRDINAAINILNEGLRILRETA